MKLLMIIESLRDGGKQRRMIELLRILSAKREYSILVLVLKDNMHYEEASELKGVKVHYLKRGFRLDPRVFFSFLRIARGFNPDIVHSWGGLPSMVSLPYVLTSRKPFVNGMIANSRLKFLSREWFRTKWTFPFSDVIIANSQIGLDVYKVPDDKKRLIRNGINLDRLVDLKDKDEIRKFYGLNVRQKVVGMVATIDWRKNFPMYVKAALELLSERNDVTFFIVGDGPDKEEIQKLIPSGLNNHFIFTGKIRNVEEVVSLFDVGVLASFGEGTSNSLLEYMLLGKPVVATDVYGVNEVIEEGVNGFLVPSNDYHSMHEKIDDLLENSELSMKMGTAGKEFVNNNYSIDQMVSAFESVYSEVLK
ncbi:glycosyltransferase [Marinilabilia rubra]|uniref:Glycosyl transferase n=1 Tax=Marinilabilia rubra TaxID=2162893 RepID=A0A2U2B7H4_9BACT|nr:glycosyltransferase [Marinilabilia rubra]PWD98993.1 glycosyl transferase [Marinilabilia rubra]